ncbi:MAG: NADPH-dependent 2,4-dienoyl-CoA reductase, partial [Novosphingobium sp.]
MANRVVMGAMHTRIDHLDRPYERIAAFYRARALGGVAMIITGGVSPNPEGRFEEGAHYIAPGIDLDWHRAIVGSVSGTPAKMCMQLLHAGRYARLRECVAPSGFKSRINHYAPRALTTAEVWRTIEDFAHAAAIARDFGYHGVEIMGSEGYLINEFTAPATNDRTDEFGGGFDGRVRFPLEIIRATRRLAGEDFIIIYRISAADLVPGGMVGAETARYAQLVQQAGADAINIG